MNFDLAEPEKAVFINGGKYGQQRPEELEKLVEIAKIQSTAASNAIEGIVTTSTRIKQLVEEKTTPKNRDEQEIAGYRDVFLPAFIAAFTKHQDLSERDLDEVQRMIDRIRKGGAR